MKMVRKWKGDKILDRKRTKYLQEDVKGSGTRTTENRQDYRRKLDTRGAECWLKDGRGNENAWQKNNRILNRRNQNIEQEDDKVLARY